MSAAETMLKTKIQLLFFIFKKVYKFLRSRAAPRSRGECCEAATLVACLQQKPYQPSKTSDTSPFGSHKLACLYSIISVARLYFSSEARNEHQIGPTILELIMARPLLVPRSS